ncbi:phage major capsid family protein [Serratia aquatilis]|uniref:Phage major capsid protein n=1 Tax=Serratia aquatilis TaxID=1737515 RepID=A0ABV6EGX9_9GAMM
MKGLMAIRAARALSTNKGYFSDAVAATQKNDPLVSAYIEKAATSGATTADFIALAGSPIARELGEYIFSQSVIGKLLGNAQNLPFGVPLASFHAIGADWLREGESIPLRKGSVSDDKLSIFKIAAMAVISKELERLATTGSDLAIRNTLTSEAVRKIDEKFLSQDSEVAGLSPAGILKDAETATDLADMVSKHVDNGNKISTSYLIVPLANVGSITEEMLRQIDLLKLQVICSEYATRTALIDASNLIANVQGTLIDVSSSSSVEMTDEPVGSISGTGSVEMVSLYQTNASAYRAITYCSWAAVGKPATIL